MAILILGELLTLRFVFHSLSAVRAFVGGESLWSKAQKNSVSSLELYVLTGDESYYESFRSYLKVPQGDCRARLGFLKVPIDYDAVRNGFIEGHIHPDDIDPMLNLL